MKDSQPATVEFSSESDMALKALPPVNVKETNLYPMDNLDDDMSEENFHLHLSEDEDEEKIEKKDSVKPSDVSCSSAPTDTEDDILNKFDAVEGVTLDNVDDKLENELGEGKLEDKLLNDEVAETIDSKSTNECQDEQLQNPVEDNEDKTNAETELPNGNCEEITSDSTETCDVKKTVSVDSVVDSDRTSDSVSEKEDENKLCVDTDANKENIEAEVDKCEATLQDAQVSAETDDETTKHGKENGVATGEKGEDAANQESEEESRNHEKEEDAANRGNDDEVNRGNDDEANRGNDDEANHEKENAEILKDQVMDTEGLLQIVENDTEEQPDKDSSGANSPRSIDKGESEDTEMECNDTETEKMDQEDEDGSEIDKTAEKDDDGLDIEEDSPYKDGEFDSDQLDKEYENLIKSKDLEEEENQTIEEDKADEKKDEETSETEAKKTNSAIESPDVQMKEETSVDDNAVVKAASIENKDEVIKDMEIDNSEKAVEAKKDVEDVDMEIISEKESESSLSNKSKEKKPDISILDNSLKSSKRSLSDTDESTEAKKLKLEELDEKESQKEVIEVEKQEPEKSLDYDTLTPSTKIVALNCVAEYMRNKSLRKLSRNDLEQICLMKMCEAICHKSEVGELRHQLGVQEQMVEMWRKEVAQLTKQARDLEIVNKRLLHEVRLKNEKEKPLIPVKITRSVGLQVRSDNSMMSNVITPKRRFSRPQPTNNVITATKQNRTIQNRVNTVTNTANKVTVINKTNTINKVNTMNKVAVVNKGINSPNKVVNSPTKIITTTPQKVKILPAKSPSSLLSQALQHSTSQTATTNSPSITATPSTPNTTVTASPAASAGGSSSQPSTPSTPSTPTPTSGPIPNKTLTTAATKNTNTTKNVDSKTFIDLTDEDDKKPTPAGSAVPTTLTTSTTQGVRIVSAAPVKAGNVVTTAGVVNPPRIMYVYNNQLHQGVLAPDPSKPGAQKLMLKLNSNVIGSANGVLTAVPNGSAITVGNTPIRPGQVQPVKLTSPATTTRNTTTTSKAVLRHPAPLPLPPPYQGGFNSRKPVPPKPHLSIRRSSGGIVLSWKMPYNLDSYEVIASYQLYAYQETTSPPSSDMWRKVGDVKALALPMACTLTQFADGNKYHFAVRAVDVMKRMGPFSDPEQILL